MHKNVVSQMGAQFVLAADGDQCYINELGNNQLILCRGEGESLYVFSEKNSLDGQITSPLPTGRCFILIVRY